MVPSDIGEFETEGEKAFYKFLEGVAKPDLHYLCWYTPDINEASGAGLSFDI
jgi:hypothetical protein